MEKQLISSLLPLVSYRIIVKASRAERDGHKECIFKGYSTDLKSALSREEIKDQEVIEITTAPEQGMQYRPCFIVEFDDSTRYKTIHN